MTHFCSGHRLPRAGIDPIDDSDLALDFLLAMSDLNTPETVALLLDEQRRGITILHVTGNPDPDAMFLAIDTVIGSARTSDRAGAVILASIRPGGSDELDDLDRWIEASEQLEMAGLELIEWFVIGRTVSCPRTLVGDPPRWSA